MKDAQQTDLPFFAPEAIKRDAPFLVEHLRGRDWLLASDVLKVMNKEDTEGNRRWIRKLAEESLGQVGSGQKGYKLVEEMTHGEYNHFRNALNSQAERMKRRVVLSDQVFYRRQSIHPGHGMLEPANAQDASADPV